MTAAIEAPVPADEAQGEYEPTVNDVLEYLVRRAEYDPHDDGEALRAEHLQIVSDARTPEEKEARVSDEKRQKVEAARERAAAAQRELDELEA